MLIILILRLVSQIEVKMCKIVYFECVPFFFCGNSTSVVDSVNQAQLLPRVMFCGLTSETLARPSWDWAPIRCWTWGPGIPSQLLAAQDLASKLTPPWLAGALAGCCSNSAASAPELPRGSAEPPRSCTAVHFSCDPHSLSSPGSAPPTPGSHLLPGSRAWAQLTSLL